ncbi:MAG: phosphate acyltransferase PlsX [Deltaproteobacteria bacterium]|nr:phosphate acyltransferase PlsX [Deltaproteobacteria bacterium]
MKIAVDAMGGDRAPAVVVDGALLAAKEPDVEIVLVGDKDLLARELERHTVSGFSVEVVHASQVVSMEESPSSAVKKANSSMKVAFDLMKRGEVKAVVSAGNSGAMMATGMFVMGNLPGVERPAILVVIPTHGKGTVIIDAGANVDCKPRHLVQFGLMGSVYAERVLGIPQPRVGLLSNGEEEGKGNDLTRATSGQIAAAPLHYIGYVEGRDICIGDVDVVVCDGFIGNVTLKTMEGLARFILDVLKQAFQENLQSRLGYLLSRTSLLHAFARLDHTEYGGAPLLGLDGVAIIAHGGSDSKAIKNAIRVAKETAFHDVNQHIVEVLEGIQMAKGEKGSRFHRKIWRQLKAKIDN